MDNKVIGTSSDPNGIAVNGDSTDALGGIGVRGVSAGVSWPGVRGVSTYGPGVTGESTKVGDGVFGRSNSPQHTGVHGVNDSGGLGVCGESIGAAGIGVKGTSVADDGVQGVSHSPQHAGVAAINDSGGAGLSARGTPAGYFQAAVQVSGKLTTYDVVLSNGDCAEDFDIAEAEAVEPGMVMVLDSKCDLRACQQPYDKRVAGIVSGAGEYRPGLILDRRESSKPRVPVALMGKAYCKVDSQYGVIEVGDLLTTSPTRGHAMKATDPQQSFGSVIGKSLGRLAAGRGLIPVLIALQ
jgi:hypothetical protein